MRQIFKIMGLTVLGMTLSFSIAAQKLQPLSIGDKVPDIEFKLLDSKASKIRLSDFKGKLVILDFWATWCSPCIRALPKIDSLQEKFKGELQILMVNSHKTRDNESKIATFFKKWKIKYPEFQLTTAIDDSIAFSYFPHREIPHYVWINQDGKLEAITNGRELTAVNIQNIISNKNIDIPLKKDLVGNQPMHLDEPGVNGIMHYSVLTKGKLKSPESLVHVRFHKGELRGIAIKNKPIVEMYKLAMKTLGDYSQTGEKKMIIEVNDSSKLFFDVARALQEDNPDKENLYTYDLIIPSSESRNIYHHLLNDLNKYSNYYGRVEKREIKCLALVRTTTDDRLKTKAGKSIYSLNRGSKPYLNNLPVSRLILGLNKIKSVNALIIDETGYKGNIDIEFSSGFETFSLEELRYALQLYGLGLAEVKREIDMFILTDKTKE